MDNVNSFTCNSSTGTFECRFNCGLICLRTCRQSGHLETCYSDAIDVLVSKRLDTTNFSLSFVCTALNRFLLDESHQLVLEI